MLKRQNAASTVISRCGRYGGHSQQGRRRTRRPSPGACGSHKGTHKNPPRRCQILRGGFLCVTGFYPFIRFASCTRPLAKYRYRLADVMATHWHYARRLNANAAMPNRSKNPDEGSGTAPEPTIMDCPSNPMAESTTESLSFATAKCTHPYSTLPGP